MSASTSHLDAATAVLRLGLGAQPGEIDRVAGDPRRWLHDQVEASAGADQPDGPLPPTSASFAALFDLRHHEDQTWAAANRMAMAESFARASRALSTPAGFRERWAWFWINHFSITADQPQVVATAGAFEREAIRPRVFGGFDDLALAAFKHPTFLIAYEQAASAGPNSAAVRAGGGGMSENLGRESLELHTVGRQANYTQADVEQMSLALTGWSVGVFPEPGADQFVFRPDRHEPGARTILGDVFADPPQTQADTVVRGLARRPETARHLAFKLAKHFVSDAPPPSLVDALARSYIQTQGSLAAVAHALVDAPETWAAPAAKFKTPLEVYVSVNRALGRQPASSDEPSLVCAELDQPFYSPPTPRGWPDETAAWASPSGLAKRLAWLRTLNLGGVSDGDLQTLAKQALGARLRPQTMAAISRTEWADDRGSLLFMSPEFQRR